MSDIHPTAVLGKNVKIGKDVKILPYCVIDGDVEIGDGCEIGPFVHVTGWVKMGGGCKVYAGAAIGTSPQDYSYDGTPGLVEIGEKCLIRESATIHTPVVKDHPGDKTVLGDGVFMMANSHVGHNVKIGSGTVLVNSAAMGGYVVVEENVFLSACVCVHQFCRIGAYAIVGAVTKVAQDVPPFVMADGNPPLYHGLNVVGLRRRGFEQERRTRIKNVFQKLYSGISFREACDEIESEYGSDEDAKRIVEFVRAAKRGIISNA